MSLKLLGEPQDLDYAHMAQFVKARGQVIGVELIHICNGEMKRDLIQWEPYGEARPLFTLTSEDGQPISVEPHISCPRCRDRGEIKDGKWVAMSRVPEGVHDTGPLAPVMVEAKLYSVNGGKDEVLPEREVEQPKVQEEDPLRFAAAFARGDVNIDVDGESPEVARERRRAKEEHMLSDRSFSLKDSGERRGFDSGAVRDMSSGKGRYDLLQVLALKRIADIMEKGAVKYDARNWEKGMPLSVYTDSAMRHLMQWIEGKRDEDHLGQAAWNLLSAMQTEEMIERGILPESLDDMPNYVAPFSDGD